MNTIILKMRTEENYMKLLNIASNVYKSEEVNLVILSHAYITIRGFKHIDAKIIANTASIMVLLDCTLCSNIYFVSNDSVELNDYIREIDSICEAKIQK